MRENHACAADPSSSGRKWWLIPLLFVLLAVTGAGAYLAKGSSPSTARGAEDPAAEPSSRVHAEVVKPTRGLLERKTAQAGTVMAFDWIDIYSEVSGYLLRQPVDRGSVVKKGDLLVEIDVPDLRARRDKHKAGLELARAQVGQKRAAIRAAEADLKAVEARKRAAESKVKSDTAFYEFRKKQLKRYQDLLASRSIDARLVDEQEDHLTAAFEAVNSAREAVAAAEAQEKASEAKIVQAKSDLQEAEAKVDVTKSELELAQVEVSFATLRARFDGVITNRNFHEGDFIREADGGGSTTPLLTLQHTEKMRMVVPIPDRDVPFCDPGAEAVIVFDALPHEKFTYPVSRIAAAEDLQTKTMRVEIDIPNTASDPSKGKIRHGMYGLATITLKKLENALTIPSACLVGRAQGGNAAVYVVRDGRAHLTAIKIGLDNGIDLGVLDGLKLDDWVVVSSSGGIADDIAVFTTEIGVKTK
jgi:HlyD family secretion protein